MDVLFSCTPVKSMEKEGGSVMAAIVSMKKQRIFLIWMACLPSGRMCRWSRCPKGLFFWGTGTGKHRGCFQAIGEASWHWTVYLIQRIPGQPFWIRQKTWVARHFNLSEEKQIYCPCGNRKESALQKIGGIRSSDVLIDDYTPNLRCWISIPIKLYNGNNGGNGTWKGVSVYFAMRPETIAKQIYEMTVIQPYSILQRIACWNAVFSASVW